MQVIIAVCGSGFVARFANDMHCGPLSPTTAGAVGALAEIEYSRKSGQPREISGLEFSADKKTRDWLITEGGKPPARPRFVLDLAQLPAVTGYQQALALNVWDVLTAVSAPIRLRDVLRRIPREVIHPDHINDLRIGHLCEQTRCTILSTPGLGNATMAHLDAIISALGLSFRAEPDMTPAPMASTHSR